MPDSAIGLDQPVERFRPMLLTLAEALIAPSLRGDVEASDLVQQTYLEAHAHRQLLARIDEAQRFAWLRNALRHNLLDAVKRLRTQRNDVRRRVRVADLDDSCLRLEHVLAADDTTPSQRLERNEQIGALLVAVQELPGNQRAAIVMKHLRGLTLREIADALALSESAVAGLLHRGRQRLVRRLDGNRHD